MFRGNRGGVLRRAAALALALGAVAAAYRFVVLLAADVGGSADAVAGSVVDRWHFWLGVALVCAAGASVSSAVSYRPRKRE